MKATQFYRMFSPIFGLSGRRGREPAGRVRFVTRVRGGLDFVLRLGLFATMALVAWGWQGAIFSVMDGAKRVSPTEILVRLTPKHNVVSLARKDLGQPPGPSSADESGHIELRLEHGAVLLRNLSHERKLDLTFAAGGFATSTDRLPIPQNQTSRLIVGGARLTFDQVRPGRFDLNVESGGAARHFHYQRSGLWPRLERADGGVWAPECRVRAGPLALLAEAGASAQGVLQTFGLWRKRDYEIASLGGRRDCEDGARRQIGGVGDLPWRALKIVRRDDEFFLAPFEPAMRNILAFGFASAPEGADVSVAPRFDFSSYAFAIDGDKTTHGPLVEITAGRTTYHVAVRPAADGREVVLTPIRKIPLVDPEICGAKVTAEQREKAGCPEGLPVGADGAGAGPIAWRWSTPHNPLADLDASAALAALKGHERILRYGFGAAAILLSGWLTGGLGALVRLVRGRQSASAVPFARGAFVAAAVSTALALAPELAGALSRMLHAPGFALSAERAFQCALLNWLVAGGALLIQRGAFAFGVMWISTMVLAGLGSCALAAMAIDGNNANWALYFVRQKYMFLDLLPPFVVALATCPLRALNPALRELVWSTDRRYWMMRYLPALMLLLAFVGWGLFGTQTGFGGGFQPAEAGKFASILIAATILLRFDPSAGPARGAARRLASVIGPALLLGILISLLVGVPVFRSDWGPALIMGLLLGGLVLFFILPLAWRAIELGWRRQLQRDGAPLAFRPKLPAARHTHALIGFAAFLAAVCFLGLFPWLAPSGAKWALGLNSWPQDIAALLSTLEVEGLNGRRPVVAARFIAWTDLRYDKPQWSDCAEPDRSRARIAPARAEAEREPEGAPKVRACYKDLEWQVVRARKAVAEAPCGLAGPLAVKGEWAMVSTALRFAAAWLAPPCGAEAEPTPTRRALEPVGPITIPVVESDFAVAYLFGRLGAGAAALFYLAQAAFASVGLWAYLRIASLRPSGRVDAGVRRFLAVLVAGSALLFVLQWTLSWSNVLGLLPVIGQPMTMLSYAVSHHLFAALPCLLAIVVGLRFAARGRVRFAPRGAPRVRRSLF